MSNFENIKGITLYRAYDVLFMGYYEYALKTWCSTHNISLKICSPKYANVTYSPRDIGIRGQMYFEIETTNANKRKCFVDISDGYNDIRIALLREVDVYFKCNCSLEYIQNLDIDENLKEKIVPSSLFFPVNFFKSKFDVIKYQFHAFFELIGVDKNTSLIEDYKRWKIHKVRAMNLYNRPDWNYYEKNKNNSLFSSDVFFSAATWYNIDNDLMHERAETIKVLRSLKEYKVHAEFIYNKEAKKIFPDLMINHKRDLSEYFNLMNNSKIVVINKSLSGGAISWRVGECLALGKVYIHEFSPNDFYETKLLDKELGVYYNSEDLVAKLKIILDNKDVYEKMQKASRLKYENYFNPNQTANYLIETALG